MQQRNPEGMGHQQQEPLYGQYGGSPEYRERIGSSFGQKLDPDYDDVFATSIAKKLKQELKNELRSRQGPSAGQRLALAIVSLCLLVPLLALIIPVSGVIGGIGAGWAVVLICVTIILVNVIFNTTQ